MSCKEAAKGLRVQWSTETLHIDLKKIHFSRDRFWPSMHFEMLKECKSHAKCLNWKVIQYFDAHLQDHTSHSAPCLTVVITKCLHMLPFEYVPDMHGAFVLLVVKRSIYQRQITQAHDKWILKAWAHLHRVPLLCMNLYNLAIYTWRAAEQILLNVSTSESIFKNDPQDFWAAEIVRNCPRVQKYSFWVLCLHILKEWRYTIGTKVVGCLTITPTGTVDIQVPILYFNIQKWASFHFCSYNSFYSSWKAFCKNLECSNMRWDEIRIKIEMRWEAMRLCLFIPLMENSIVTAAAAAVETNY